MCYCINFAVITFVYLFLDFTLYLHFEFFLCSFVKTFLMLIYNQSQLSATLITKSLGRTLLLLYAKSITAWIEKLLKLFGKFRTLLWKTVMIANYKCNILRLLNKLVLWFSDLLSHVEQSSCVSHSVWDFYMHSVLACFVITRIYKLYSLFINVYNGF